MSPAITLEMFCSCESCCDLIRMGGDSRDRAKLTLSKTPYGSVMASITHGTFIFSKDQKHTVANFLTGDIDEHTVEETQQTTDLIRRFAPEFERRVKSIGVLSERRQAMKATARGIE